MLPCDRATGVVVISENPLRLKSEPRSCGKGSRRDSRCLQLRRALDLLASVPPSFPARLSFSQSRRCRGEAVSGPVPVFLFEPLFHLPIGKNRGSIPDAPLAAQKPRQLLGELVSADRSAVSFPSAPRALSACRPPPPNWDDAESPDGLTPLVPSSLALLLIFLFPCICRCAFATTVCACRDHGFMALYHVT
jgi:hypothetical protein